jgi:hypothetical protein
MRQPAGRARPLDGPIGGRGISEAQIGARAGSETVRILLLHHELSSVQASALEAARGPAIRLPGHGKGKAGWPLCPLADSLLHHRPEKTANQPARIEARTIRRRRHSEARGSRRHFWRAVGGIGSHTSTQGSGKLMVKADASPTKMPADTVPAPAPPPRAPWLRAAGSRDRAGIRGPEAPGRPVRCA